MQVQRHFTTAGQDAYAALEFRRATSEIKNPDGSIVSAWKTLKCLRAGARWRLIFWRRSISARPASRLPEARRGRECPILAVAFGAG